MSLLLLLLLLTLLLLLLLTLTLTLLLTLLLLTLLTLAHKNSVSSRFDLRRYKHLTSLDSTQYNMLDVLRLRSFHL